MTAATAGPSAEERRSATDRRLIATLVVLVVLTQRVGLPVGGTSVSVSIPLAYAFLGVMLLRARLAVDRMRLELYAAGAVIALVITAVNTLNSTVVSLQSLVLLLVLYLPWVTTLTGSGPTAVVRAGGRAFVQVMTVLAIVGACQLLAQLSGAWSYVDYLSLVVPSELLVADYNTSIPLEYGSDTYKSNAFVMLEPSLLSQFCALAFTIGLALRARVWQMLVLVTGMVSALSGTGFILLAVGLALTVVRAPRTIRPLHLLAAAAVLLVLVLSPLAPLLLERSSELSQPGSSGYARFVKPYTEVARGLEEDPRRFVLGGGAGTAEQLLASREDGIGDDVLYSTIPKLAFEYGLLGGGVFLLLQIVSLVSRSPWRAVPGALLVMIFFLGGGLLQPQTAFLAWALAVVGSRTVRSAAVPPRAASPVLRRGPGPRAPAPASRAA